MNLPRVYAITDFEAKERSSGGNRLAPIDDSFASWLDDLASSKASLMLQIREKRLSDRTVFRWARRARERLPKSCPVLVNGRADIARAAGADGVHLPSDGIPIAPLRRRFGSEFLIGRSTHSFAEARDVTRQGADFITFGPVYSTPSKAHYGPPVGLDALREAVALPIPVFALGGVSADHVEDIAAAGAAGIAGIRSFLDPVELARVSAAAQRYSWHEQREQT